jgi:multicomponent Na+:H+ antiporter subunit E
MTLGRRALPLSLWCLAVWILVTWTRTLEQLAFGAALSVAIGLALAPLGEVVAPWSALHPRRLVGALWLVVRALVWVLVANVKLALRIWNPKLPLTSGMVETPTAERSEGGLAAVGLITSLIVDNQIVDLDRGRNVLLYHAVAVPEGGPERARREINGPLEALLTPLERHPGGEGA